MLFLIILALFIIVPVAEIALFIELGGNFGVFNTLLLIIITAVLGASLVRQQGFQTLANVKKQTAAGNLPAMEMAEGAALLFAGALLLTPGFLTDTIGFCLLIPPLRRKWIRFLGQQGFVTMATAGQNTSQTRSTKRGNIIEGEYHKEDD
ncbi:MAG TPA: exlusion protein FxsA [Gammaproteobacteria bacterium]|jgi:UPF0716 protein FxsA|nr:exlusion protein FxsA [Gammaproteobacteria bacterium]